MAIALSNRSMVELGSSLYEKFEISRKCLLLEIKIY